MVLHTYNVPSRTISNFFEWKDEMTFFLDANNTCEEIEKPAAFLAKTPAEQLSSHQSTIGFIHKMRYE